MKLTVMMEAMKKDAENNQTKRFILKFFLKLSLTNCMTTYYRALSALYHSHP